MMKSVTVMKEMMRAAPVMKEVMKEMIKQAPVMKESLTIRVGFFPSLFCLKSRGGVKLCTGDPDDEEGVGDEGDDEGGASDEGGDEGDD